MDESSGPPPLIIIPPTRSPSVSQRSLVSLSPDVLRALNRDGQPPECQIGSSESATLVSGASTNPNIAFLEGLDQWMGLCDSSLHMLKESLFLPAYTFREKLRSDKVFPLGSVITDYAESLSTSSKMLKRFTEDHRAHTDKISSLMHSMDLPNAGSSKGLETQEIVLGLEKFVLFLRSIENASAWRSDIPTIILHAFEDTINGPSSGRLTQVERYAMRPWSLLIRTILRQAPESAAGLSRPFGGRQFYLLWSYCKVEAGNKSWTINMEQPGVEHAITTAFHSEPFQQPRVDVFFGYSSTSDFSQPTFPMDEPEFEKAVYSEMRSKMRTNFEGQRYISKGDLLPFCEAGFVRMSFQMFDTSGKLASIAERIAAEAPRLHAACRYSRLSMTFLMALLEAGFHDLNLPPQGTLDHPADFRNCRARDYYELMASLASFFPLSLGSSRAFWDLSRGSIIPIQFDWRDDVIGRGAFSEVYKVLVDPTLHTLCAAVNEPFALKVFSGFVDAVSEAFSREQMMLRHFQDRPHAHLLTHLGSWTQENRYYILYPLAAGNLRAMINGPQPDRSDDFVLWLLDQLIGLADAIGHIHRFVPGGSDKRQNSQLIGVHHDIKPENILVFGNDRNRGTLKLSDFGTGRISHWRGQSGDAHASAYTTAYSQGEGTLTYMAPEAKTQGRVSRPFDIWAVGCVILEILVWVLMSDRISNSEFSESRLADAALKFDSTDAFWLEVDGLVTLRPSVQRVMVELRRECHDKWSWELFNCVERLLNPDPKSRPQARQVVTVLQHVKDMYIHGSEALESHSSSSSSHSAAEEFSETPADAKITGDIRHEPALDKEPLYSTRAREGFGKPVEKLQDHTDERVRRLAEQQLNQRRERYERDMKIAEKDFKTKLESSEQLKKATKSAREQGEKELKQMREEMEKTSEAPKLTAFLSGSSKARSLRRLLARLVGRPRTKAPESMGNRGQSRPMFVSTENPQVRDEQNLSTAEGASEAMITVGMQHRGTQTSRAALDLLSNRSRRTVQHSRRGARRASQRNSWRDRRVAHVSGDSPPVDKVLARAIPFSYNDAPLAANVSTNATPHAISEMPFGTSGSGAHVGEVDLGRLPQIRKILQDPEGHQRELQREETALYLRLEVLGIFQDDYADFEAVQSLFKNVSPADKEPAMAGIAFSQVSTIAEIVCSALLGLKDAADDEISYSIIVQDMFRSGGCNVVSLSLESLEATRRPARREEFFLTPAKGLLVPKAG